MGCDRDDVAVHHLVRERFGVVVTVIGVDMQAHYEALRTDVVAKHRA